MATDWIGKSRRTPREESRTAVARYHATVRLDVEKSSLEISTRMKPNDLIAALVEQPDYCPIEWPACNDPSESELRRFAILKFAAFFEFGSRLPSGTRQQVRRALGREFPELAQVRATEDRKKYKAFKVDATIWDDGTCDGGFNHPSTGKHPPIGKVTYDSLDILIKNLVRADLRDMYEAEGGNWPAARSPLISAP